MTIRSSVQRVMRSTLVSKLVTKGEHFFHCAYLLAASIEFHDIERYAVRGMLFAVVIHLIAGLQNEIE